MVDVINLRQLYKQQEIMEVKWNHRYHNPANFMTKAKPSSALKTQIDSNCNNIIMIESIEYANMK